MLSKRIVSSLPGNDKVMMTPIGGIAIRLTNKTGAGLAKCVLHFN